MAERPEINGRAGTDQSLIAVTVHRACEISGIGKTSIWALLKDGRLKAVRVPGVRRTLVSYASLAQLLAASQPDSSQPLRRGRPRKLPAHGAQAGAIPMQAQSARPKRDRQSGAS